MNNNFQIDPDLLKNIKVPNITLPEMKAPSFIADEDCVYYDSCNKLQITEDKICCAGADIRHRCSFGETRSIKLLSRLLTNEDK